ncbi:MAG TPA: pyridoxamine 5'-phosphate oxidase family protein [Chthoniobacterales bacterium]
MTTTPPATSGESFSLEDSDDIFGVARQLIDGHHFGVLTTVDSDGAPHARWMATMTFENFPRVITLTSAGSSKVKQIRANQHVDWLFANEDFTLVLNLKGRARVFTDTVSIKRAWKAIKDKSHAYFLNNMDGDQEIAVIETVIERIDYTSAQNGLRFTRAFGEEFPTPASLFEDLPASPAKEHCLKI